MSSDRLFTTDDLVTGDEPGVRLSDIANALYTLVMTRGEGGFRVSVAEAAQMFNLMPAVVLKAVAMGYWLFLEDAAGGFVPNDASFDDPTRVYLAVDGE